MDTTTNDKIKESYKHAYMILLYAKHLGYYVDDLYELLWMFDTPNVKFDKRKIINTCVVDGLTTAIDLYSWFYKSKHLFKGVVSTKFELLYEATQAKHKLGLTCQSSL